ncbi:hypothetical protein BaRGS_00018784, partial [Batillaria attramentaria]
MATKNGAPIFRPNSRAEVERLLKLRRTSQQDCLRLLVEKAVDKVAWSFLAKVFEFDDTGQRAFDCFLQISSDKTYLFWGTTAAYRMTMCLLKRCLMSELFSSDGEPRSIASLIHSITSKYWWAYCSIKGPSYLVFQDLFQFLQQPDFRVRWDFDKLLQLLVALEGEGSSCLAVVIAAACGVLDDFIKKLKKQPKGLTGGLMTAFWQSMHAAAWNIAARILQEDLGRKSFKWRARLYCGCVCETFPSSCLKRKGDAMPTVLDAFLRVCRDNGWYGAGALVAHWRDHAEGARMLVREENEGRVSVVMSMVIGDLQSGGAVHWHVALDLVRGLGRQEEIGKLLNLAFDVNQKHNHCQHVVMRSLASLCQNGKLLLRVCRFAADHGLVNMFNKLLPKYLLHFQSTKSYDYVSDSESLLGSVAISLANCCWGSDSQTTALLQRRERVYRILCKCVEAGLSTAPSHKLWVSNVKETALYKAVVYGALNLVRVLYMTVSNAELRRLRRERMIRVHLNQPNFRDIRQYLDVICSTPRSLEDLCRLTVSRHLGCGVDRKCRGLSLGLPMRLVYK